MLYSVILELLSLDPDQYTTNPEVNIELSEVIFSGGLGLASGYISLSIIIESTIILLFNQSVDIQVNKILIYERLLLLN